MTKKVTKKHAVHRKPAAEKLTKKATKPAKARKKPAEEDVVNQKIQDLAKALSDKSKGIENCPTCPAPPPTMLMGEVVAVPETPKVIKVYGRSEPFNDKKARMPAGTALDFGYDGESWRGTLTVGDKEIRVEGPAFAVLVRGLFKLYNEWLSRPADGSA